MNLQLFEDLQKNFNDAKWIYISLGFLDRRAHVFKLKNNSHMHSKIQSEIRELSNNGFETKWIRVDVVNKEEKVKFTSVLEELPKIRRNYVEFGLAFDSSHTLSFLSEEINANAFVRPLPTSKNNAFFVCEKNINTYLKKYKNYRGIYFHKKYMNKDIYKFYTSGYLLIDNEIIELIPEGYMHGVRTIKQGEEKAEYTKLIGTATNYLLEQIDENGRYEYGKFPHFDKKIAFYNILRHTSSTYSLLEGLEFLDNKQGLETAKKTIDYLIDNYIYIDPAEKEAAYLYDDTNNINEIKLGQNGVLLIMLTKYMELAEGDEYIEIARKIANGTRRMIDENGETVHVLNYPDLTVKEENRIIYYDGEAAFGLMRLYQIDPNPKWLDCVETLFSHFIKNEYWKYSDHWLSYCTYELTKVSPKEEYFVFGLKNISKRLDYIYQRETTFPTFLEMLMAGYRMVGLMKEMGLNDILKKHLDEAKLRKVIEKRADYQRTGYFYPEIAMYFKNPADIWGSFFIKHHGYRVRIDDVQHYISGYIQFVEYY